MDNSLGASAEADQALAVPATPLRVDGPSGFDPSRKAEQLLRRIIDATHSHINGRDLLAEIHPRKTLDIKRRVDGVETWFEGDWLSTVWDAVKEAKAFLYSRDIERNAASAMSAGTAETQSGSGLQPASAMAKPDAQPTGDLG